MKDDRNREDAKMDKLIRESLGFEKSPDGFTDKIMQHIEAVDQKEEKALSSLMGKYVVDSPSPDFTKKVMAGLQASTSINVNPVIIGKKAWFFIYAAITAFVIYIIASGSKAEVESDPGIYSDLLSRIGDLFSQAGGSFSFPMPEILTNPVFGLSLFALSSLLLVDYVLKNRKLSVA
jgi:hypothetical protein